MHTTSIHINRIQRQNACEIHAETGAYVLYWMQQAQRAEYNHALEFAVDQANALQQPCLVIFGLADDYPDANLRHYTFMRLEDRQPYIVASS